MTVSTHAPSSTFQLRSVLADGSRVSAQIGGDGPPIVLFHSLLADASSFDLIAAPLAASHQVVVLNLPGFGQSASVDGGLEAVADRIAAAIQAFAFKEVPIFLGNGYGGFVALLTAIRHPGITARLVLADCGAAFSEPGRAAFRGMSAAASANGLTAIADIAMRRLFSPAFQAEHPALIAERRACFLEVDPHVFHAACAALSTLDLRGQLDTVKVPVLVLVGEFDEATPPAMSEELAKLLPHAELKILQGCAHVPQLQEPALFMATIGAFIG